jgi:hypothetical protein
MAYSSDGTLEETLRADELASSWTMLVKISDSRFSLGLFSLIACLEKMKDEMKGRKCVVNGMAKRINH